MRLISHITHVQVLRKGEAIGYGGTYVAEEDMRTATIPIGYADGFHRALSNKGSVLVNGKRHRIIGRICMDQMMIAAGDDVQVGMKSFSLAVRRRSDLSGRNCCHSKYHTA